MLTFLFSFKKFPYIHSPAQKVNGRIKRQELQHIINAMVVKLSDSDFKDLMRTLDPGDSGLVDISRFLELLEESRGKVSATAAAGSGPVTGETVFLVKSEVLVQCRLMKHISSLR